MFKSKDRCVRVKMDVKEKKQMLKRKDRYVRVKIDV